jgi:transcriptional regulator of heat shock response
LARQRKVWYNIKGVGFKKFYPSQIATVEANFNVNCARGRGKGFKCTPKPNEELLVVDPVVSAPKVTLEQLKQQAEARRTKIEGKAAEARTVAEGYGQKALDFLAKYNINVDTAAIKTQLVAGADALKSDALNKAHEYARVARTKEEAKEIEIQNRIAERKAAALAKIAPLHLDTITAQEIKSKVEAKKAELIAKVPEQYAAIVNDLDAIIKKNADEQFARISKFANKSPAELAAIGKSMIESDTRVTAKKAAALERVSNFFGGEAGIEAAKAQVNKLVEEAKEFSA